jgi:hypothetical protein
MRRLMIYGAILAVALVNIAATGTSQANATAILSIIGLVLPFVYKYVPAAGHYMVAITVGVSIIGALAAEVVSKEVSLSNLTAANPTVLYMSVLSVYGLSQFMFAALKQSPSTVKAVA